jgi:peptide/nickel transport system permease protein
VAALLGAMAARLAQAGLVALAVATLCFASLQALPGDLAMRVAASRYGEDRVSAAMVDNLRHQAGLDRPVLIQYGDWLAAVATGELGTSLVTGRPVVAEIAPRLRVTALVGGLGVLAAFLLAVPAGIAAGRRPGSRTDRAVAMFAALLASTPSFVLGGALVAVLAVRLRWLPVAGDATPWHLVLPVVSLGCVLAPGLARVVRHAVAEALSAFPTSFARMRGVSHRQVALLIAGRSAMVPVAAYLPVLAMHVLEGFVAIELLFNLDGIGQLLVRALLARDIPVVAGIGIALAALLAASTLAADLVLHALDPRLRR